MTTGGRVDLIGWALFAVSGVVFFIAALRDGDPLPAWDSITWLAGVAFLPGRARPVPQPAAQALTRRCCLRKLSYCLQ